MVGKLIFIMFDGFIINERRWFIIINLHEKNEKLQKNIFFISYTHFFYVNKYVYRIDNFVCVITQGYVQ